MNRPVRKGKIEVTDFFLPSVGARFFIWLPYWTHPGCTAVRRDGITEGWVAGPRRHIGTRRTRLSSCSWDRERETGDDRSPSIPGFYLLQSS